MEIICQNGFCLERSIGDDLVEDGDEGLIRGIVGPRGAGVKNVRRLAGSNWTSLTSSMRPPAEALSSSISTRQSIWPRSLTTTDLSSSHIDEDDQSIHDLSSALITSDDHQLVDDDPVPYQFLLSNSSTTFEHSDSIEYGDYSDPSSTTSYDLRSEYYDSSNSTELNSNSCVPFSEAFELTAVDAPPIQITFGILYSFIWIFSITSNSLVLFVTLMAFFNRRGGGRRSSHLAPRRFLIQSKKTSPDDNSTHHRKTMLESAVQQRAASFSVRTIFVISLACSDLLTALTSLPVTAFNIFTHQWHLGRFLCRAIGFMQAFAIFQSSFTFSFIAIDRYLVVAYPDTEIITYRAARFVMAFMAFLAALLATPMFLFVDTVQSPGLCGEFCVESWPEPADIGLPFSPQRFYSVFILVLQYGLPAALTTACYILIAALLRQRHRRRLSSWCQSTCERRLSARRRRMNRMMSVMVLGYVLAWSPFNALSLLRDFELFPIFFDTSSFSVLFASSHLIAMTTLVLNPIIYAWFNQWVRDAIFGVFRRCLHRPRIRESSC